MIRANFNTYHNYMTDTLYQWDLNQDLVISGLNLTVAPEIHFTNSNMNKSIVKQSSLDKGIVTVRIPNSLLQETLTIKAYVGLYEGGTFKVIEDIEIPVTPKSRPYDYSLTDSDEEIYSFKKLENEIASKVDSAKYADDYSKMENSIKGIVNNQIPEAYVKQTIDNYISNNNGGFVTGLNFETFKNTLSTNGMSTDLWESGDIDIGGDNVDDPTRIRTITYLPLNEIASIEAYNDIEFAICVYDSLGNHIAYYWDYGITNTPTYYNSEKVANILKNIDRAYYIRLIARNAIDNNRVITKDEGKNIIVKHNIVKNIEDVAENLRYTIDAHGIVTLAKIAPSTDLDPTYDTVEEANEVFNPETRPVENKRCLLFIALKNAGDGTMFYDSERDTIVTKVAGKWCDLQVSDASEHYNF